MKRFILIDTETETVTLDTVAVMSAEQAATEADKLKRTDGLVHHGYITKTNPSLPPAPGYEVFTAPQKFIVPATDNPQADAETVRNTGTFMCALERIQAANQRQAEAQGDQTAPDRQTQGTKASGRSTG